MSNSLDSAPDGAQIILPGLPGPGAIGPTMRALRVYRTYYDPAEDCDGEHGDTVTETELIVCEPDPRWDDDDDTAVSLAVERLQDMGVAYSEGASWFYDPDGSYCTDYYTGEQCETSAHPVGWTEDELVELFDTASK